MAFATLFKAFNPDSTNWLSIAEYIALTLFLQSASAYEIQALIEFSDMHMC